MQEPQLSVQKGMSTKSCAFHIHLGLVPEGLWEQGRDSPPLAVNKGPEKTPGTGNRLLSAQESRAEQKPWPEQLQQAVERAVFTVSGFLGRKGEVL